MERLEGFLKSKGIDRNHVIYNMNNVVNPEINIRQIITEYAKDLQAENKELKEKLESHTNLLEDVVNELDLSEAIIQEHGPNGTAPSELVRLVLEEKDKRIQILKQGFKEI